MSNLMVSSKLLVSHFFDTCEKSFSFLCEDHGFDIYCGMLEFRSGRKLIRPFKFEIGREALSICRLEHGSIAIEITYAQNSLSLDCHIYYDFINRFELNDIIKAAKKPLKKSRFQFAIISLAQMDVELLRIRDLISDNVSLFTKSNKRFVQRALKIRSKRIEFAVRTQYKQNMDDAISKAAKAFFRKDYRKVVELYKPFEQQLRASDKKKYERAIEKLTNIR